MRKIISNPQQRVKDCYAEAPKIDLVLRTNGEEKTKVIDPIGNPIFAGLEAPTVAPTVAAAGSGTVDWLVGTTFTGTVYWEYRYVYVAKTRYPLVENAITGGGSPAPRSNPSPSVTANNSSSATRPRIVTIPTTKRDDISHIWIYRTSVWDTADKASVYSQGGIMFWVGEVSNNPNLTTVDFTDTAIVGAEQIENDNFVAPTTRYCKFDGIYFWAIANDLLRAEGTLDSTGLFTITDGTLVFDGRDGQLVTFDGITSGGFDGHGTFYAKIIDNSTIRLYQNLTLTTTLGTSITGTTMINIRGPGSTLYRSKPKNPFSWGYSDLVNDLQVPNLYAFSLGGGRATSLAIVPGMNLLKIDLENPNRTVTFNLKNAGTPSFEPSMRPIADSYNSSIHHAQFAATVDKGRNQLWSLDTKSFAIVDCDGTSQTAVAESLWKTLRSLAVDGTDREFFHGVYHPRLELNCMFVRTEGVDMSINRCFYHHWPTNQWGIIDAFDILCSAAMLNPFTNETEVYVGNSKGWIGEFGAKDVYSNWCEPFIMDGARANHSFPGDNDEKWEISFDPTAAPYDIIANPNGIIGNWVLMYSYVDNAPLNIQAWNFRFARIANVETASSDYRIILENNGVNPYLYDRDFNALGDVSYNKPSTIRFIIGPNEMIIGRMFNVAPFRNKKLEAIYATFYYPEAIPAGVVEPPTLGYGLNYSWNITRPAFNPTLIPITEAIHIPQVGLDEMDMNNPSLSVGAGLNLTPIFGKLTSLEIDQSPTFGIIISDRNPRPTQILNYQINLTPDR